MEVVVDSDWRPKVEGALHEFLDKELGPEIAERARRFAPKETGALALSVESHMDGATLVVSATGGDEGREYAAYLELGHRVFHPSTGEVGPEWVPARPFLRPALYLGAWTGPVGARMPTGRGSVPWKPEYGFGGDVRNSGAVRWDQPARSAVIQKRMAREAREAQRRRAAWEKWARRHGTPEDKALLREEHARRTAEAREKWSRLSEEERKRSYVDGREYKETEAWRRYSAMPEEERAARLARQRRFTGLSAGERSAAREHDERVLRERLAQHAEANEREARFFAQKWKDSHPGEPWSDAPPF